MELDWYLSLILFGILHWILAIILLGDLMRRERVLGGRKAPWVIAILLITFLGSLVYLLCHPKIFYERDSD